MDRDALKRYREQKGLTQRELADRAGVSASYVNEIENGRKRPSLRVLNRIAAELGVPAGVLVGRLGQVSGRSEGENYASDGLTMGDKLRLARLERGLTLTQLASETGLSPSHLSDIERGHAIPAVETLSAIAAALRVRMSDLIRQDTATLGEKIQRLRANLGISRQELARSAGLSPSFIAQLEDGKARASLDSVERLATALGVSPCYLILSDPDVEDMLAAMTPDLRRLLSESQVQTVLRALCDLHERELRFILQFIRLYKESLRDDSPIDNTGEPRI